MYLTLLNLLCLSISLISGQITYPDMRRSRCGWITEVGLYFKILILFCIYLKAIVYHYCVLYSSKVDSAKLARNVKIVAEALAIHVFGHSDVNSSSVEVFVDGYVSTFD